MKATWYIIKRHCQNLNTGIFLFPAPKPEITDAIPTSSRHCVSESIHSRSCYWPIVGLMVGHRLRLLANIKSALTQRPVIVESSSLLAIFHSLEQLSALNGWEILVRLQTKLVRISKFSSPNARRWPNVGFMLGQRLRWWPNIGGVWGRPL